MRPYWRSYYPNTNAVIYVVDSVDKDRLETSKQELLLMLEVIFHLQNIQEEELKGVPLLVFANKQVNIFFLWNRIKLKQKQRLK